MHIIKTLCLHDITSFHDVMTSLMTSSHAHAAGHMTFSIKEAACSGGMVLLPKTFKRLDRSKHALVAMHQVCP